MIEHKLMSELRARAFTPGDGDVGGNYGTLAEQSMGDWSWKPYRYDANQRYRYAVTGPRCTCTLARPVGTDCARHSN